MLVAVRYLSTFGVVRHDGIRARPAQPVILTSCFSCSSVSKSEKNKRHISLTHISLITHETANLRLSNNQEKTQKQCEHCGHCLCVVAACLTCCIEWAFVHMVSSLVQQPQGLRHVICRSHGWAGVATGLLEETKSIVRAHHVLADPPQTPAGQRVRVEQWSLKCFGDFGASYK